MTDYSETASAIALGVVAFGPACGLIDLGVRRLIHWIRARRAPSA